ncbi:hypothetical protein LPU83_pLPU83b_0189 (plasmid) [Rhizobium favelukesii]|uniref:Uncharacterized protein n=1 Tax=Rhizobium favelukesii TaxID=348824 RepID=W6RHA0_9HYPH|nr:hypothetical protein LPU83_pLPU83b_0189 [Rhizobium favelukesii]
MTKRLKWRFPNLKRFCGQEPIAPFALRNLIVSSSQWHGRATHVRY